MRGQSSNLYRTLQVDPGAEEVVIRAAFRALMKQYHPDHGGEPGFAQQLNTAYATLADPVAREAYDRQQRLRRRAAETAVRESSHRPLGGARSLIEDLGAAVFQRFVPQFPEGFARVFDFVGVLREAPRHRVWLKRAWRGDATDARAFSSAVEAARLSRPLWTLGSDLFVAVLPAATTEFRWLLRGPVGPLTRLSYAITLYDLGRAELQAVGRCIDLPTFRPLATALEAGRPSGFAAAQPNT